MIRRSSFIALVGLCAWFGSAMSHGQLIFNFQEVGNDVVMTSSGTINTAGLVSVGPFGWVGVGIEENGEYDVLGSSDIGLINLSFAFNPGTSYAAWATALGPWDTTDLGATILAGSRPFATYVLDNSTNEIFPGLGINSADMSGTSWTPDQSWQFSNQTFQSLQMRQGTYTVTDVVTGASITYLIGSGIPEPTGGLVIAMAAAMIGAVVRRRQAVASIR